MIEAYDPIDRVVANVMQGLTARHFTADELREALAKVMDAAPVPAQPAVQTYSGPCMCARDHCQNRTSMPHPTWKCRKESQPAVPDDVAKDAKTVLGMEHGQVLVLRRADTKQSCGIGALFGVGICPYIHRLDGSRIYLGCHAHGDKFTGVFEALAVPKVEWPDAAILSAADSEVTK